MTKRELNQRRISWATRGLAGVAALATAVFAAAAQHTTKAAKASSGSGSPADVVQSEGVNESADDGFWSTDLTPSQSAPQQTFSLPVASSGGS